MPERLVVSTSGEVVGAPVRRARTLMDRTRGLMGTRADSEGPLVFERVRQVHTFGMTYPIDVIFCDAEWRVVQVVIDMKPRRVTKWVRHARITIELPSAARRRHVAPGDVLALEPY